VRTRAGSTEHCGRQQLRVRRGLHRNLLHVRRGLDELRVDFGEPSGALRSLSAIIVSNQGEAVDLLLDDVRFD
jgi:hypothetical protein